MARKGAGAPVTGGGSGNRKLERFFGASVRLAAVADFDLSRLMKEDVLVHVAV